MAKLKVTKPRIETIKDAIRKNAKRFIVTFLIAATLLITWFGGRVPLIPTWSQVYAGVGLGSEYGAELKFEPMPLTLTVLDVGQGESIFIYEQSGTSILIDSGPSGNGERIVEYMELFGVEELDYLIFTHPHDDHVGSAEEILSAVLFDGKKLRVKNIVLTKLSTFCEPKTEYYKHFLYLVNNCGAGVASAQAGTVLRLGEITLTFLAPLYQTEELNNMSLVTRIDYGNTSFLLMGDAQKESEASLLNSYLPDALSSDVLVVGHHGSENASSTAFVKAVSPAFSIISCGRDNGYGHPHQATLDSLSEINSKVYRTDENGHIVFGSDGQAVDLLYTVYK